MTLWQGLFGKDQQRLPFVDDVVEMQRLPLRS
jgi:hypothetical protein